MRRSLACLLVVAAATSVMLPAQKGANPGFSRKPQPSWIILNSFNSVPGTDIQQIFHCKLPTDKDGRWTTCVTVAKLPKFSFDAT